MLKITAYIIYLYKLGYKDHSVLTKQENPDSFGYSGYIMWYLKFNKFTIADAKQSRHLFMLKEKYEVFKNCTLGVNWYS